MDKIIAKDYLGKTLKVGDTVVFANNRWRKLDKGIIKTISPKKVTIIIESTNNKEDTFMQFHEQVFQVKK